jgi:signal transduction histidine kinase
MIREHGAEIEHPAEWPVAVGHEPWVEEVWVNYLSNAIKYGGRPPRIELGAELLEYEEAEVQDHGGSGSVPAMVRFWVRDNGPGIRAEEQAQLFKPYTRLQPVRASGHGLGLSIVRRIVEKLGGEVAVESKAIPGEGCVFSFTLPAGPMTIESRSGAEHNLQPALRAD